MVVDRVKHNIVEQCAAQHCNKLLTTLIKLFTFARVNIFYFGILEKTGTDTRARTDGHGQTDTKDGQLWKRRALMEKTDSYGKDGQLWKRRALMENTDSYGKDGQLWKRRALMENTDTYGKDGHLWKRRAFMEKTGIKFLKARF